MRYLHDVATTLDAKMMYSNPKRRRTDGPSRRVSVTEYWSMVRSSASKHAARVHTRRCASRVVLGDVSTYSTRSEQSQWKILTKRSVTNMTTNLTLNSSRNMVIARQVSMMASLLRSYSLSTSASRSCPRKMALNRWPRHKVSANMRLPITTTLSLLVERYSIAGKYCSRVLRAWYTRPPATTKEPTTYLVSLMVPRKDAIGLETRLGAPLDCRRSARGPIRPDVTWPITKQDRGFFSWRGRAFRRLFQAPSQGGV